MTIDEVAAALSAQQWTFAKTMPDNPHDYALRKKWVGPSEFETVVQAIRDLGERRKYGKASYVYLTIGEHKFWTMGAPLKATILINRALVD